MAEQSADAQRSGNGNNLTSDANHVRLKPNVVWKYAHDDPTTEVQPQTVTILY
jgi:hypothetical protein